MILGKVSFNQNPPPLPLPHTHAHTPQTTHPRASFRMERVEKSIQTLSCGWNPWSCSSKGSMLNAHYHPSGPFQEQVFACRSVFFKLTVWNLRRSLWFSIPLCAGQQHGSVYLNDKWNLALSRFFAAMPNVVADPNGVWRVIQMKEAWPIPFFHRI